MRYSLNNQVIIMKLRADPVPVFWAHASVWRKLRLLRTVSTFEDSITEKYLDEMQSLLQRGGGFSRVHGEPSSVSVTAEAIINLVRMNRKSPVIAEEMNFLWKLQNQNGGWHENPNIPKDKVPFWSSTEKGVPILTGDCIEAAVEGGYKSDPHTTKGIEWLKQMQSPSGMWLSLEGTDPSDTEPDSTQRAISALIRYGIPRGSDIIKKACNSLERFILEEAVEWAKTHPPVWPWMAPLEGLIAAGYDSSQKAVQFAMKNILNLQQEDGGWPNQYELRAVPALIALNLISSKHILEIVRKQETPNVH
jgi:squalene cyclase